MPKICAATSGLDTYIENSFAAKTFYIWISHFLETAIFRTRFHPKSERRGRLHDSAVCRPPATDAHRRGLSQPPGAYARHYGFLWRAQRARAPCMTRSTGRLVALPVQKATCNTWGLYIESATAGAETAQVVLRHSPQRAECVDINATK